MDSHLYFIVGCLQSVYGIHTCRIESMAYGKSAPVDELQVQGVTNPCQLQKVICGSSFKCFVKPSRFGNYKEKRSHIKLTWINPRILGRKPHRTRAPVLSHGRGFHALVIIN